MAGPELWQLLGGLGGGDPLSLLGSLGGFPGGLGSLLGGGRGPDLLGLLGRLGAGADSGPVVDVEPEPVEGGEDGGAEERAEAPPRKSAEKKGPRLDTGQLLSLLSLLGRMGVHPPGPGPSPGGYGAYAGSPPGYAGSEGESWSPPPGYAGTGGESWSPPGYAGTGGESWSPSPGYAGTG
ncbi:MAG: hypothetical protein GX637_04925, partial [Clostridiales bacterium]|nr:hypothetical protein [Clostridiales bacterium]